ncbi:CPBP family intramembrane glutamic endopeptidase [Spirosoma koreense]
MWTTLFVVFRAGVVEELFFRGYIIERLTMLTNNRYLAAFGSLISFALFHYSQGMPGMILALILGGVLMGVYMWRKDLKSVMMAHFLIDFIPNVLGTI